GLKESRRLKHRELNLVMGNRKITSVTRIGKYELMLKSGVRIDLNNCCYSSEMTRNIISFHALFKDGYKFLFNIENGDILVYSNGKASKERLDVVNSFMEGKAAQGKSDHGSKRKRSCPTYLKDLKDGKVEKGGHSGLKESRRLKHRELNLVMGNRKITSVTRIGKYELMLKSGLTLPRTPQLNGVAKRRNRTLLDMRENGSKIDLEEIQESADKEPIVNTDTQQEVVTPVEPDDISLPIRRTSSRVSKPHQFYYGFHIKEDKISDSTLSELDEPANDKEAMASPEVAKWKEAMKSEIQSMYENQVWNLVDTTPGLKTVGCKWIFKKKANMDGKMDVKTAFLRGKLTEDVFMAQPEGFENANMMCQHQQDPGKGHWTAIKNILKYLRNTKDRFLVYSGEEELRVTGYYDASWKIDKDDTR
nr:hypothetical protein [Tanacetum cinerariifolium]